MRELAGFDVIGEVHIETITDLINRVPVTNPVDGKAIYLFGGPFSTDIRVDLGPRIGTLTFRLLLHAEFEPQPHQALTKLLISFEGGAELAAPVELRRLGGQLSALVPVSCLIPSGPPGPAPHVPSFQFEATHPDVHLDLPTRDAADHEFGPGGADHLEDALRGALAAFLSSAGTISLPLMGFTVVPGQDSHSPTQLAAPPTAAWIDATTLGVFGYYRSSATGGNVWAKTTGDLEQPHEEFFYSRPGLFSVVPGRRVALLLSADAFDMVIACPAVQTQVVRQLVFQREHPRWVDFVRSHYGDEIERDMAPRLGAHYLEELKKDPGRDVQTYLDRAKADIAKDVENEIERRATADETTWLDGGSAVREVALATPAPCGAGAVEVARIPVAVAQGDLVPILRRLQVRLSQGKIAVEFLVNGMIELLPGDVSFSVAGELDITILVDDLGRTNVKVAALPLNVNVNGSGATGTVIDVLKAFFGDIWTILMTFVSVHLDGQMTQLIQDVGFPTSLPPIPQPAAVSGRLVDIQFEAEHVFLCGLVCREPRWNEFNPALLVDAVLESETRSDAPEITSPVEMPATAWGCKATSFVATRTFWDETYVVRARLRDAPVPATVVAFNLELGNFSWNTIGNGRFRDVRPRWTYQPQKLADGQLTLAGEVEHLDPLLLPELHGPLTHAQVPVTVSGDADNGWRVTLRGTDGNFYVRFAADVLDGDENLWHGETFIIHHGDRVHLPDEYFSHKRDCDARFGSWLRESLDSVTGLVATGHVAPGQPVMDEEVRDASLVRTLVEAGSPTALLRAASAADRHGAGFILQVALAPAFEVRPRAVG